MQPGNLSTSIDSLRVTASSFLQDHLLLLQLKGTKKIARLIALMSAVLSMVFLGFCVLFLISAIGCYYLINLLGSVYAGLGIITGIYIFLFILLIALRKKYFQTAVANTIIRLLFDAKDNTNTNEK